MRPSYESFHVCPTNLADKTHSKFQPISQNDNPKTQTLTKLPNIGYVNGQQKKDRNWKTKEIKCINKGVNP